MNGQMSRAVPLSVIIPAHDEAAWIEACLGAVIASDPVGAPVEVIIAANGCTDDTAALARSMRRHAAAVGIDLNVIELTEGSKIGALNAGDAAAVHAARVYLDADVRIGPGLLAAMARALHAAQPRYVSGTPDVSGAQSWISRAYGRFWMTLPFNTEDVGGYGVFAMNGAGRARWGTWPDIIADDMFARLNFAPSERTKLPQGYAWPLVEGFSNLVRVRRRQNRGVAELARLYPELMRNGVTQPGTLRALRLVLGRPLDFAVYASVGAAVRSGDRGDDTWARGR